MSRSKRSSAKCGEPSIKLVAHGTMQLKMSQQIPARLTVQSVDGLVPLHAEVMVDAATSDFAFHNLCQVELDICGVKIRTPILGQDKQTHALLVRASPFFATLAKAMNAFATKGYASIDKTPSRPCSPLCFLTSEHTGWRETSTNLEIAQTIQARMIAIKANNDLFLVQPRGRRRTCSIYLTRALNGQLDVVWRDRNVEVISLNSAKGHPSMGTAAGRTAIRSSARNRTRQIKAWLTGEHHG